MYKTKLVTGKPHQFTRFFYAFYLTIGSVLEVSVRMVCPSCKKRRPSSKAPASKNICDYISNAQNKETQCFFVLLCFYKQTKQTLEVLSFIMKKQDNFLKEVVSFLKKLLVSRKQNVVSPKLTTSIVGLFFMPVGSFFLN